MQSRYEIIGNKFFLIDEELNIHFEEKLENLKLCKQYYLNGTLKHLCYYLGEDLHGPSYFYSQEGNLLSETWFFNGKKQGKVKRYYLSKALYSLERFKDGVFEGKQEYYYEDGRLKTLIHYQGGLLHGETSLYWPDGSFKRNCHFFFGKKEGFDRIWDDQGKIIEEEEYKRSKDGQIASAFERALS